MSWFEPTDPIFSGRLCLTLLHSIWQVAILAFLAHGLDRLWQHRSVQSSYATSVLALLLALVAMPITYALVDVAPQTVGQGTTFALETRTAQIAAESPPANSAITTTAVESDVTRDFDVSPQLDNPASQMIAAITVAEAVAGESSRWLWLTPWVATLYAVGVVWMLIRLVVSIVRSNRLGDDAFTVASGSAFDILRQLAGNWSMKIVPALAVAEHAVMPKVVGMVRPTVLLPVSALSGLSRDELEMILAHELAHVRRHDMWVNLLQRLAEAALFFNPALWFLSRRISALREYCCDEMACEAVADKENTEESGDPRTRYALALLHVVELMPDFTGNREVAALAVSGRSPSELRRRVARLLDQPLREPVRMSPSALLTFATVLLALTFSPAMLPSSSGQTSAKPSAAEEETGPDAERVFQLSVVGPDGRPVAQAGVEIRATPAVKAAQIKRGTFVRKGTFGTFAKADGAGVLSLTLSRRPQRLNISIKEIGYGPYWAAWTSNSHPQAIPDQFTAELDEGWSVGGVVVDGNGAPVEGAEVHPSVSYKKRPGDTDGLGVGTRIKTDPEGKWRFDYVPASSGSVHVAINHPDYGPLRLRLARDGFEVKADTSPAGRIALKRGLTVAGTVTDELGQPIAGALVRSKFMNDIREARTDTAGVYHLKGCEPRMARIVVSAAGRATDMREISVDPEMDPINFSMKPGGHVRVRVVDKQGKGIPKARIFFQHWRGRIDYFEFDHISQYTDKNGIWEWNEAPLDEFKADICHPRGMQLSKQSLIAREEEYVFHPPVALVVSGSVVDAKTKQPVPKFRVIPGLRNEDPTIGFNWIPRDSYVASDGKYRIRLERDYPAHLVRIEADGYKVSISRDIQTDEGEVDFDFELQPAADIAATILTAAGKPAGGAKIALGVAGSQINIDNGAINDGSTYATQLDADPEGRFSIPARDEPFQIVITHGSGFAYLKSVDGPIPSKIALTPWARAEGTFRVGTKPVPSVVLSLYGDGIHSYGDGVPNIFTDNEATTGKAGRYVFDRVFPGKARIGRRILLMVNDGAVEVTSSQRVSSEFTSGETTKLDLGGSGRAVVGTLAPPAGYPERVLWKFALVNVTGDVKSPTPPAALANLRNDPIGRAAWLATDEGKAWTLAAESYDQAREAYPYITASVDRDGSFRIDDMPSGNYVLKVRFSKHSPGVLPKYGFIVPPQEDDSTDPLDLGVLTME